VSWIDKLIKRKPKNWNFAPTPDGWTPIFSQFGDNIYASDVVQQAIKCICNEMKKLNPKHVRENDCDTAPVKGKLQKVLDNPNERMTTSDFLEKITWLLMLNYNAFIVPVYKEWTDAAGRKRKEYQALYPIKPVQVDFIEDASGTLFVYFRFANEYETTVKYEDIIHIKYQYSVNDYMGGNEFGQPDHTALLETLKLNDSLLTGVAKAMNASYAINGVIKYNTLIDDGKTEAALRDLEKKLMNNVSGFLPLDLKTEFTPLERHTQLVDEQTLEFIDEKILRYFGVPLPILKGDYTKVQYSAFYESTLEPLIISYSQAFTKGLFTKEERSRGNKIEFMPEDLIFMTVNQVLHMVNLLSSTGALYENEKRKAFGLAPLPELEGKRYMSLNWIDVDIANRYQLERNEDKQGNNELNEQIEKDLLDDTGETEKEFEREANDFEDDDYGTTGDGEIEKEVDTE